MQIEEQLISRLENLAKLELSADERSQIMKDLNNILAMVGKLQELDTENVDPLVYVSEVENAWRTDEIRNQVSTADALSNAPHADDAFFKVPKVIDL